MTTETRSPSRRDRRMGSGSAKRQVVVVALLVMIGLAVVGWLAAQQIKSPAQIAAEAAAPSPSAITVPVQRRRLSTKVIVRGTVRFGGRSNVELGTSQIKQGSDIVTTPARRRARLDPGEVAMAVDARPVFVMPGLVAMHRDLKRGSTGPDVMQLELFLASVGFPPGTVDGRFDAGTQGAVAAFYASRGYEAFGPTDAQLDQLRVAQQDAAVARDAHLQAVAAIDQARRPTTPGDVEQARIDSVVALDALHTAELAVPTAQGRLETSQRLAATAGQVGEANAVAAARRDQATADADVLAKADAVALAEEEERLALADRDALPLDAPSGDRVRANVAVENARNAVVRAEGELAASKAVADSLRSTAPSAVLQARDEAANLARDVRVAEAELQRAEVGVAVARRQVRLTQLKAQVLGRPVDTSALEAIADATADEEQRTREVVARLAFTAGVQVPANEILFFPSLPVRVDEVKARRGSTVSGPVMTVTSSSVIIDSSLGVADVKLVHVGDGVVIEDQDLGLRTRGRVAEVDSTPGTRKVDPNRFYFSVVPREAARAVVGASVKLTIAVKSTGRRVLAVPVSAISVGGDGSSRVEVQRRGRRRLIRVIPGLAAEGYVQVRPARSARLHRGDLVVVGSKRGGGQGPGAGP
jgi:peptidoglycan hydrolase-like protein with peptidoglycan-binding domain